MPTGVRVTGSGVGETGALSVPVGAPVEDSVGVGDAEGSAEGVGAAEVEPPPPLLPLTAADIVRVGVEDSEPERLRGGVAEAQGEALPLREAEGEPEGEPLEPRDRV